MASVYLCHPYLSFLACETILDFSRRYFSTIALKLHRKIINELQHDKTSKMICASSKDSDQPGHHPSLISVFIVCNKKPWVLSYPYSTQWRLWSDWVDAQADLSLRWAHIILLVLSCCASNALVHVTMVVINHIGDRDQWRLRRACTSTQSHQSLHC